MVLGSVVCLGSGLRWGVGVVRVLIVEWCV